MDTIYQIIKKNRPKADHSIEQYLMNIDSLELQLELLAQYLANKKVLFIGDDDHFSLVVSSKINAESFVFEIDDRIIRSQQSIANICSLSNHSITKYDVRNQLQGKHIGQYNAFVINPPYGSKNTGYGLRVWLSRALEGCVAYSVGVIVLPILIKKQWTIDNIKIFQTFLLQNNCIIFDIHKDVHSYEDLPEKDIDMKSSNIIIMYFGGAKNLLKDVENNLYR